VLWGDDTHLQKRLAHIAAQGVTSPELSGISSGPADSPLPDTVHKIHAQLASPDKDTRGGGVRLEVRVDTGRVLGALYA
jgi:hypothetical protein